MQADRRNEVSSNIPIPAISVRHLKKTYPGNVQALEDLTFSAGQGSIFALLGPNGAGKSTTVRILTTLSRPDHGEVEVCGIDVLRHPQRIRHMIGCVVQRSAVDVNCTARENLTLQGQLYGLRGRDLKSRIDSLLDRMGLSQSAGRLTRTYSGGMQRKLDIALALIHRPTVLFLDEPTTGLDPQARAELWEEIAGLSQDGVTILLTTHYLEEADRLADRMAIVDRGRIVVEGAPDQLKTELRGDSIEIKLVTAASPARIERAFREFHSIQELRYPDTSVHARVENGASAAPAMLLALESDGIRVASVKVARPSLDDVYLRYTGRTFQEAEKEIRQ